MKFTKEQLKKMVKESMEEAVPFGTKQSPVQKTSSDKVSIEKLKLALDSMEKSGKKDIAVSELQNLARQNMAIPEPLFGTGDITKLPAALQPKKPANVPVPPASIMATKPAFTEDKKISITKEDLRNMVKEALKTKLNETNSKLQKDVLPGSDNMGKFAEDVDNFLMKTSDEAKELAYKLEEEMKVDMLGGEGKPGMAPRVGERNRMLANRVGALRRLGANCIALWEYLRREG